MEKQVKNTKGLNVFEKYLTLWVALCIAGGIVLGRVAPGFAEGLDKMAIYVGDAPVVSIPIAVCLFFMMYPIMVKIDFAEVMKAGKSMKPVGLTLFVNWAIKPFTMYAICLLFLGTLFYGFMRSITLRCRLDSTCRSARHTARARSLNSKASRCWKFHFGEAIWRAAFCSGSRPVLLWSSSGGIWPKAMTGIRSSWLR